MKKSVTFLLTISFLLVVWANGASHSSQLTQRQPGNIPDGMYIIVGESSHRCLEVPNDSCRSEIGLQSFDCDPADKSNNQKFNVVADGSGYYTISPVHSDLCVEVSATKDYSDRIPVQQNECSPGKVGQKWAMSQYGDNLEIRAVQNNQCLDVVNRNKKNYAQISVHACVNGTNQRWGSRRRQLTSTKALSAELHPAILSMIVPA